MKRGMILLTMLGSLFLIGAAPETSAADFKVVVNDANPIASIEAANLAQLFLKKQTRWDDGSAVKPVDLSVNSSTRAVFTKRIHGRDVNAIQSYWQKQIFSGRATPPPEMSSDADVVAFVRMRPGAIGYVSSEAAVGKGVKVVGLSE
ncbi:MAG: substrate-binding domain-containing protein [Vicinamibacteria bacterium]|nr:substrate-binding domain-containing protein [Vicinamibacteria bacterium]